MYIKELVLCHLIFQEGMDTRTSWCLGKGFDSACPVGEFIAKDKIPDPHNVNIWLKLNSEMKQFQNTGDMIFSIPRAISYISSYMTLEPGDLIVTGSPPGYGCVKSGDSIHAGIDSSDGLNITSIKYEVAY